MLDRAMNKVETENKSRKNRKKKCIGLTEKTSNTNNDCSQTDDTPTEMEDNRDLLPNDIKETEMKIPKRISFRINVDIISLVLFLLAVVTRFYRLSDPRNIVFDELHYGKYVGLYLKRTFFFDSHPPFGKQLIAIPAYLSDFDGKFKFNRIGSPYSDDVPLFALRFVPALSGCLLVPVVYHLMLELGCQSWIAVLASFLVLCDNAILTQSRFILMEPMLILFALCGLYCLLVYLNGTKNHVYKWHWLILGLIFLTLSICVKYAGWFSWLLGTLLIWTDYWHRIIPNKKISDKRLILLSILQSIVIGIVSIILYLLVFYVHLHILNKAGPHDSVMTSAFQASLEGGLASITKGQPTQVVHGSQITLRHTYGRTCWLHSHSHVYPIRYSDKRGSSHQQQVTCYTYKDVNNWWIVKRPDKNTMVVGDPVDVIKHGDIIQLVHGITSRALNTHDVAAPMSPHNQEVSCYVNYNVSMPAQNLWKVDIINGELTDGVWHSIQSMIRLIHVNSSQALKFSGRQLPDWGFHQHEVVADKLIQQEDTIWNVEEHRYTKSEDEKERERDMVAAEMIPLRATSLSFWDKFYELQHKMFFNHQENIQNHMYSSDPIEWPLTGRGIAYWVSSEHNGQIYLLGNVIIWYSGVIAVLTYITLASIYLLRRRRQIYDIDPNDWDHFVKIGQVLLVGYILHYVPYFFVDRTLFLHHYLPALVFKCLLTAAVIEHIGILSRRNRIVQTLYFLCICCWILSVFYVFRKFIAFSYGITPLSAIDVIKLKWKSTWDFIIHTE